MDESSPIMVILIEIGVFVYGNDLSLFNLVDYSYRFAIFDSKILGNLIDYCICFIQDYPTNNTRV